MALQPSKFNGQDRLQPGARGEIFQADYPGYRNQGDRLNRTNNKLATNQHDVPNIKYEFDRRLPVLFRYGFAYGYNQIVIPKGRVIAADPFMDLVDFDMRHQHNTLTLANGGAPVRIRTSADLYRDDTQNAKALVSPAKQNQTVNAAGKEWIPLVGFTEAYTATSYRPFKTSGGNKQLADADYTIDPTTGKAIKGVDAAKPDLGVVRPGNIPLGILSRNEYTRDDDAYNGIMPGAFLTDAMVELPWFAYKDKAEENPWGSAYGGLFPGALVKSDENGRFVVSPLSFPETECVGMAVPEYEAERQQVVGQVYAVDNTLIPEGAAKWATWALEDRLNFIEFNPDIYRQNNRNGEDSINHSPYASQNEYPGYPYDKAYSEHDLHMLASTVRHYSQRMNQAYQYENLGIPGLTDGQNAATRTFNGEDVGTINYAGGQSYVDMYFRTSEVNVVDLQIKVQDSAYQPVTEGALIAAQDGASAAVSFLKVKYVDALQGIVVLGVTDQAAADTFLQALTDKKATVTLKFNKKGLAGVPTFLDWDGCVGSVKVLLTK